MGNKGKMNDPVVLRYEGNPILTKDQVPYPVETVHNPGVVKYKDRYIMLFRSHLRSGRSIIGIAESENGVLFKVRKRPFMVPSDTEPFSLYEEYGVEDPRITYLDGRFLITYSAYSRYGVRIGLAETEDFSSLKRISLITEPDHRNVVIFPERFNGRYARLDRPHTELHPWSIWISYSNDLIHWGDARILIKPLFYHWDEMKIGPGAPPIKTDKGWLNIFHGVFKTMDGAIYRAGVAFHRINHPEEVLLVSDNWILQPEDPWEKVGYVHNVVFCSAAVKEEGGAVRLYWGGADTVICTGITTVERLWAECEKYPRAPLS